jgi:excinuclease ABC subunit A
MLGKIIIKGARVHNLKKINLEIPKNKLVVFSGVSGSGKSSLAMDTLYAEGQRRYVESLSTYARQFLGILPRPEVDTIEGLSPAIAIDQHGLSHNPRSTVGTVTEIYDYLRVLFARVGHPHCPQCGREVAKQTSEQISKQILALAQNKIEKSGAKQARVLLLAPVVRDKRGEFSRLLENLRQKGFEQVRIDGHFYELSQNLFLIKTNRHNIEVVVDRISLEAKKRKDKSLWQRVLEGVEIALNLADGLMILLVVNDKNLVFPRQPKEIQEIMFSSRFACPVCNLSLPEIEPRLFSFNSPFGACPECNGLGIKLKIDLSRVPIWRASELEHRYYTTSSEIVREEIEKLMVKETCSLCQGTRLKKEALNVTIDKDSIAKLTTWSLDRFLGWLKDLNKFLDSEAEKEIAEPIINQVISRLNFLISVGVTYLTLDRPAATLSTGEGQRIRLASQVGSGLSGVLYILDEPTVGLHPRDVQKLIKTLKKLRDLGNTVIVVEHETKVLKQADWLVDFGPGAGKEGGKIVAEGPLTTIIKNPRSLTGAYLSGRKKIPLFPKTNSIVSQNLVLSGCQTHNLKNLKISLPLANLICVTGVSGSGKSSLISDTLYPALKKALDPEFKEKPGEYQSIKGTEYLNRVLAVDQSPIGRTSRSNPATYIGVFTDIRQLFALTREARLKGFTISHFSFNTEGGRCEACQGQGQLQIRMQFLPDIWVECEECQGKRFKPEVLEVEYKEKNIAQILKLTVAEAQSFFASIPVIQRKLAVLQQIGLDYLELGQPSPTLSGGEAQRLKLARELVKTSEGKTLYLLDEPTTGLHLADLKKLLQVLRALVDRSDTVVVIEHNLEVIKQADWVIDLGPEGGEQGGYLVAEGPVDRIAHHPSSWTGKYLRHA